MNKITLTKTIIVAMILMMTGCSEARRGTSTTAQGVSERTVKETVSALLEKHPDSNSDRLQRGVAQAKAVLFFILVTALALIQLYATRSKEVQQ